MSRARSLLPPYLCGFALLSYVQRSGISVFAESLMRDLGLDQQGVGWVFTAFVVGYTVFQIPGAVFGESLGPRRALTLIGAATILATLATALTPLTSRIAVVLSYLIVSRLCLGAAQAALFPVTVGAIEGWLPRERWGASVGLVVASIWIGTAITPPVVSLSVRTFGWRVSVIGGCLPLLLLVIAWHRSSRLLPPLAPRITQLHLAQPSRSARIARVLRDGQLRTIFLSYFLMNYVFYLVTFWAFLYLRQERHLSLLSGGGLSTLPFLAAAVGSAAGGRVCDRLCARLGARWGVRILPLCALPCAALCLWLTGLANSAGPAMVALSLAFGCCEITESSYWAGTMRLAPGDAMAATAVLNTSGSLAGVVATPLVAMWSAQHAWNTIFAVGALATVCAAALWLRCDVTRREAQRGA